MTCTLRFRRRAVSTVIVGIIFLTLLLTSFTALVVVGSEYDSYETQNSKMNQQSIDRLSENITAVYPGIILTSSEGCTSCEYDMVLSNQGGVAVQITQIYINSTVPGSAGCTFAPPTGNIGPCVLNPTSSNPPGNFQFNKNDAYLNSGELNHTVRFSLPFTLPNEGLQGPSSPANTIWIVTARGRVFMFQYPFAANPLAIPGFTPNLIRGDAKIAWCQSGNCAGAGGSSQLSCHSEPYEVRSGPPAVGNLYFVNPWIDPTIMEGAAGGSELIYVYVRLNNTSGGQLTLSQGTIILEAADAGSNAKMYFAGGPYLGVYYPVTSTSLTTGTATIDPLTPGAPGDKNGTFIALFQLATYDHSMKNSIPNGAIFTGTIAVNNQAEDNTYSTLLAFTEGVYVRPCNTYSP